MSFKYTTLNEIKFSYMWFKNEPSLDNFKHFFFSFISGLFNTRMNNKPEYFDIINIKNEGIFNYFHKQNKEKVKIYYTNYLFGKNYDKSKIIILDINKNKTCLVFVIDSNIYHETLATVNFCHIYDNNGKTYKVPGACRNNFK